jgi:DNA-binding SARP family transcriptional activator
MGTDLQVRVLGEFEVEGIDPRRLGSRKARTLLKVLALARGQPVPVDRLVDCLWPEAPPARPSEQVAVLVSRLRAVLGGDRLPRTGGGYALVVDRLDVDAAAELAAEAEQRLEAGDTVLARAACSAALALLRGPLLADEPDAEWAAPARTAAARLESSVRRTAARAALGGGDHDAAAELAPGTKRPSGSR